jgi:hypothetical protein
VAAYFTGNTTILNAEELHHSAGRHPAWLLQALTEVAGYRRRASSSTATFGLVVGLCSFVGGNDRWVMFSVALAAGRAGQDAEQAKRRWWRQVTSATTTC